MKSAGTVSILCYDPRPKRHGQRQRWQEETVSEFFDNGSYDIQRGGGILPLIIGNRFVQEDFINEIALPILESPEVIEGKAYFDVIMLLHSRCKAYDKLKEKEVALHPNFIWNERKLQIEHMQIGDQIIHKNFPGKVRTQGWREELLDPEGKQIKYERIF